MLNNQKGQALLIIVLVMVVALTVGLSVASRTITNLRNTSDQASSQKALSAAEAGVEQVLKNGVNIADSHFATNTSYTTSVSQVSGAAALLLNGGALVKKNDGIYVWITPYSTISANLWQTTWNGNLNIYWGDNSGDCNNAAIEVSVISGSKASPDVKRDFTDPCDTRRGTNYATLSDPSSQPISGKRFYYQKTISITNGLLVRVVPIYKGAFLGVSGSVALPSQGSMITSIGTSDKTIRRVTVFQGYPEIPTEFFPYILFQP